MGNIMESVKGFVSKTSWEIQKKAPEILLVTGIVTTVAGVVAACRATIKAQDVVKEYKHQMEVIEKSESDGKTVDENGEIVEYTHEDAKKDRVTTKIKCFGKCVKYYALAIILIGLSIFCQIKGYKTLSKRLAMASAAYAALASRFKNYRAYITDKFGIEEDKAALHGMKAKEIVQTRYDEDGNPIEEKKTVMVADDDDYSAIFTKYNPDGTQNLCWSNDLDRNLTWLKMEQSYLNHELVCRKGKPITLNEVRKRLGLPLTAKGSVVGWTYEPNNPNHHGDNYIDFGLEPMFRAYRNGDEIPGEASLVLDFNVDGEILYAYNKYKKVA